MLLSCMGRTQVAGIETWGEDRRAQRCAGLRDVAQPSGLPFADASMCEAFRVDGGMMGELEAASH